MLIMAGEDDELSPIEYTYKLYEEIKTPKKLFIFEGRPHFPTGTIRHEFADWIQDRFKGRPFESEIIYVTVRGQEMKRH